MKKWMLLFVIAFVGVIPLFSQNQEYRFLFSGSVSGHITVREETNGRIVIIPSISVWGNVGSISLSNTICSLLPHSINIVRWRNVQKITIYGNTTMETWANDGWERTVVAGNITTVTNSDGNWIRTVVEENITTVTSAWGGTNRTVIEGNTTMTTFPYGWRRIVVEGNTTIITSEGPPIGGVFTERRIVDGNSTTAILTPPAGTFVHTWLMRRIAVDNTIAIENSAGVLLLRVEKHGNDILVYAGGNIFNIAYAEDSNWPWINFDGW